MLDADVTVPAKPFERYSVFPAQMRENYFLEVITIYSKAYKNLENNRLRLVGLCASTLIRSQAACVVRGL